MSTYHDLCLREASPAIKQKAKEIGWSETSYKLETVFLEAEDWGELKRKINRERQNADVLVFKGGDEELNRKAAEDTRIDILLHPEKGRKDSGINHVIAKEAAESNMAIGLDFQQLRKSEKIKSHILRHWERNLMLCEKFEAPYVITTGAREKYDLRAPRDLKSIIDSLGYKGTKAVTEYPERIMERAEKRNKSGFVRPGVEKTGENK